MITVRTVDNEDAAEIAELTNSSYSVPYKEGGLITRANDTSDTVAAELSGGAIIFVAEMDKKIIGAVRCRKEGDILLSYKLAVAPDYRKQGVGGLLIQKTFDITKELKYNKIEIVVAEAKGLVPYYEKFGFKTIKREWHKSHYEIIMHKAL